MKCPNCGNVYLVKPVSKAIIPTSSNSNGNVIVNHLSARCPQCERLYEWKEKWTRSEPYDVRQVPENNESVSVRRDKF